GALRAPPLPRRALSEREDLRGGCGPTVPSASPRRSPGRVSQGLPAVCSCPPLPLHVPGPVPLDRVPAVSPRLRSPRAPLYISHVTLLSPERLPHIRRPNGPRPSVPASAASSCPHPSVVFHRIPNSWAPPLSPFQTPLCPPGLTVPPPLLLQTIGAAFVAKVLSVGEQTVTLGIWDTAGSERYEAMSRIYYRGARAAVVCYDLTNSSSFQRAKFWVNELQNCEEGCRIYLCGTKSDLLEEDRRKRDVDFHDVQDYADEVKAELFETSSKTGQNVDELFQKVAEDYVHFTAFQEMTEEKGVDLGQKSSSYLYSCCHH
uniref:Ras-related protein Rab-24 n=2 Tax=Phasianidae TaxID=9005 RepID=A0A803YJU2_MELGA